MSTKEHGHGCDKLWSEESPNCIFNYHKKPESTKSCKICNEVRDYTIQIGKDKNLIFCDHCGQILALGLKLLQDAKQIEVKF